MPSTISNHVLISRSSVPANVRMRAERELLAAIDASRRVLFLDIETTGLSRYYDEITIVGYMSAGQYHVHVRGEDPSHLLDELASADTLVTFNGTLFDVPFLLQTFEEASIPATHIDLRYATRRLGLTGGQKALEELLGIRLRNGLEEVDGAEAVLLWHRYLRGDIAALKMLVRYNLADIQGMCEILDFVVDQVEHPDLWVEIVRTTQVELEQQVIALADLQLPSPPLRENASSFYGVFGDRPASRAVVVGVDLTGSEAKPSGYCLLKGNDAETSLVGTDSEIISRILQVRPELVSIDSPLCLPMGRTRVTDDDPGRDEFGIMRISERILKRRGINVYPCLLPSMQKLTERGIRLAAALRSAGVPVIESYPGAAQDIMGIPRKGAGPQWLQRGLAEFGISGDFVENLPSHDELDAITSALVGTFLLDGKFEALGGEQESALIVPNLKAAPMPVVIGLSGRIAAGKTTAARWIEASGYAYTRFSLVIDDEIVARNLPLDRATRQAVGMEIHEMRGQPWLCEQALKRVGDADLIVVDGLRWPEDHAFFVERFGNHFRHIHIRAPIEMRMRRSGADGTAETREGFLDADAQPVESMIDTLGQLAAETIDNFGSIDQFHSEISRVISQAGIGVR